MPKKSHRQLSVGASHKAVSHKTANHPKRAQKHLFHKIKATVWPKTGFTLIELLITLSIVDVASWLSVSGYVSSQSRARDARRKSDLEKVKIALEDYYNDNACYPPAGSFDVCGAIALAPYLATIPCDPYDNTPYLYAPLDDQCDGYRLHAKLEKTDDPAIASLDCVTALGCGYGSQYNYGTAAGESVYDPDGTPPAPGGYVYACDASGVCNQYQVGSSYLDNCPVTFPQSNCNNNCGPQANRCN